jgi:thiamine biosynthesis protein ThiI
MVPEYAAVLLRYGEIGIKSKQTRRRMTDLLVRQVELALEEHGVHYSGIDRQYGRVFIRTSEAKQAAEVASRIFGIVSVSPVVITSSNLDEIIDVGEQLALKEFEPGQSFRVGARRVGEHDYTSQEIREKLGERLFEGQMGLPVDLHSPQQEIYVEVRHETAYLFTKTVKGVGGMPTGTQGKVVCTVSTGLDSPVAAYKVMKRGCIPVFVYFDNSPHCDAACTEVAIAQTKVLASYIYGHQVKMYIIPHASDLDEAMARGPEKMTCLFCKRNMLRLAREVAILEQADAIVTGEIIGEQASQTTANLRAIDTAVTDFPILRPLAGDDKVDIMRAAQQIGTYEFTDEGLSCCNLAPRYPSIKADRDKVYCAEEDMDLGILQDELKRARVETLREWPRTRQDPS